VDGRTSVMILFLVLLWALPISQDVEEAFTEEWVLDHHLAGSLNIPAEIVRVALRIRRCILPAFITSATLVLMFTDDVSAKHVILNFLAITSITGMDNVLAALFLGPHHREMMEEAARDVKIDTAFSVGTVFLWSRVQGLFCALVFLVGLVRTDGWIDNCDRLQQVLVNLAFTLAGCVLVGQAIYMVCVKKSTETTCKRIFYALIEVCRNLYAIILAWAFNFLLNSLLSGVRA